MRETAAADGHLEIGWEYHQRDARSYRSAILWYRGTTYEVKTFSMTPRSLKRKARKMVAELKKPWIETSEDL